MSVETAMQFPAYKEAQGNLDAKRKELRDVFAEAGPDFDLSKVKSVSGDNTDKLGWIRAKNDEINALKSKVDELIEVAGIAEAVREEQDRDVKSAGRETGADRRQDIKARNGWKSFGDAVVDSKAFKEYRVGSGQGPVARIEIPDIKALFQTSAGWDPEDTRTGTLVPFATRPAPVVVDAFPQTTTSQSTVLYMEETTFTNTAAETAEAGPYVEASLALTERSSEVRKIAVYISVTDEQFEDEPRARGYINNRLPFMLRQRLDGQLLVGNGTAPNLRGTENVAGINTQALGADSIPDAIYKGMTLIRTNGFAEPSVVFIAPSKWETVRLLKTADGAYVWGHPSVPGPETIWGVPVIQTTAHTATKAILGDYRNFAELAVRRGVDVQVSNSHSDYFVNGKLAIRADLRCALIHYRPTAFTAVTGL